MIIHHLSETNSILNSFLAQLRDIEIQKDRMRFRRNIERVGEIMAYELSKTLHYENQTVKTPLAETPMSLIKDDIVIASVLRAGLPLHNGLLNYFDKADNSFISAYRHHEDDPANFEIVVEYLASASLENKTLVLVDPMLASGKSMVNVHEALKKMGRPKNIHLVAIVGAPAGIDFVSQHLDKESHLWIAAIDEKLNDYGYIVPGLGDAGDLSFGSKLQH